MTQTKNSRTELLLRTYGRHIDAPVNLWGFKDVDGITYSCANPATTQHCGVTMFIMDKAAYLAKQPKGAKLYAWED